jgi:hypothetical protein
VLIVSRPVWQRRPAGSTAATKPLEDIHHEIAREITIKSAAEGRSVIVVPRLFLLLVAVCLWQVCLASFVKVRRW